jgi:predicted metal-dependent enzyme (double-stranded beta helix superfamily)
VEQFIRKLKTCSFPITEKKLKDIILNSKQCINYKNLAIEVNNNNTYLRIKLLNSPFDIYLMVWPENVASAVHEHNNFWGYVLILEGNAEELVYSFDEKELVLLKRQDFGEGNLLPEENNAVHQIRNNSNKNRLVTLNIYYPPSHNMNGSKIFDIENKRIGILNSKASSMSWNNPPDCFNKTIENAFEYREEVFESTF